MQNYLKDNNFGQILFLIYQNSFFYRSIIHMCGFDTFRTNKKKYYYYYIQGIAFDETYTMYTFTIRPIDRMARIKKHKSNS